MYTYNLTITARKRDIAQYLADKTESATIRRYHASLTAEETAIPLIYKVSC